MVGDPDNMLFFTALRVDQAYRRRGLAMRLEYFMCKVLPDQLGAAGVNLITFYANDQDMEASATFKMAMRAGMRLMSKFPVVFLTHASVGDMVSGACMQGFEVRRGSCAYIVRHSGERVIYNYEYLHNTFAAFEEWADANPMNITYAGEEGFMPEQESQRGVCDPSECTFPEAVQSWSMGIIKPVITGPQLAMTVYLNPTCPRPRDQLAAHIQAQYQWAMASAPEGRAIIDAIVLEVHGMSVRQTAAVFQDVQGTLCGYHVLYQRIAGEEEEEEEARKEEEEARKEEQKGDQQQTVEEKTCTPDSTDSGRQTA